ncbi:Speckle-type POZ protein [Striga asiatica]|uniref:Speckle-type POZ protein n=1 Tax=Striga asiatica TaxID=4170 RepID=A0A5A7RJ56_STRAF|nr:Speckle-type POZ protein [Striga asiatica]
MGGSAPAAADEKSGINMFKSQWGIVCLRSGQQSGSPQFIKRSFLETPGNGYLSDDCLRLLYNIGILDRPFPINHPFLRFPGRAPATASDDSLKEIYAHPCLRRWFVELLAISSAPQGKLLESVIWATKLKHKMKED